MVQSAARSPAASDCSGGEPPYDLIDHCQGLATVIPTALRASRRPESVGQIPFGPAVPYRSWQLSWVRCDGASESLVGLRQGVRQGQWQRHSRRDRVPKTLPDVMVQGIDCRPLRLRSATTLSHARRLAIRPAHTSSPCS